MDARARHDKMHEIGQRIEEWTLQICPPPFWSSDGTPNVNYDLLREVMRVPVRSGASARSGKLAAAIDLWCAWEFGHAGFSGGSRLNPALSIPLPRGLWHCCRPSG